MARPAKLARERALELIALVTIVALAATLRFANLDALGDANHYYTAAVEAMSQSWHNFFFVAAEPGGSVSVDKPPVGLWFQVFSARLFGVNGFGVLLPQIVAGILSVIVVYHLVHKAFGAAAGLLAGLALAITPIGVATDRNNTMDSTLILMLLLAAWAFIVATERGKLRYLFLGAILVGVGFNIKMLQAYLPVPAFYALYLLGSPERWWRKAINLALITVALIAVSLSWATIVDLTPEEQRPYVGSSGDNSEWNLITGYNGLNRLLGMGGRGNLLSAFLNNNPAGGQRGGAPRQGPRDSGGLQPPQGFQQPQGGPGGFRDGSQPAQGGPGGFGGGGMFNIGQPGAFRLFIPPLSKNASWLLPLGLFSAALLLFRARLRLPLARQHQTLVLWGGWLGTAGIFFSIAEFYHEYYVSMLAPALAALVGIGLAELWRIRAKHPWLALGLILIATGGTLWLQVVTATAIVRNAWWLPLAFVLLVDGIVLLIPLWDRWLKHTAQIGYGCMVAALLLTPAIWSGLTTLHSSNNQSLPAAFDGQSNGPSNNGRIQVDQSLLSFLQTNTQGIKYLMAVPSSMQGSDYVIATGRPVLYLGGFMGQDQVATSADLERMVANGELRYIYWNARGGGFGGPGGNQSDISSWVTNTCMLVGFDTLTQNTGAPDGTPGGMGNMQISLYDCAKRALTEQ